MFRTLLAVLVFMVVFIYLSILNPQKVQVVFAKGVSLQLPVAILLVVTAAFGFALAYLLGILKDIKMVVLEKRLSAQSKVKEKLVEACRVSNRFSSSAGRKYLDVVKTGDDPYLLSLYGSFLREIGALDEAKEIHTDCALSRENSYCLSEFLRDLCEEGRFSEVVAVLKDVPKMRLTPSLMMVGVDASMRVGDWDFALSMAEKLFKMVPSVYTESLFLGVKVAVYEKKGDVKGIKKVLKKRPGFVPAIKALEALGETPSVVSALKEAYKSKKDVTYLFWLIDTIVKEKGSDPRKTIDFIDKLSDGDDVNLELAKAYLFAELGMFEEALKLVGEGEGSHPLRGYVKYLALKGLNRYEESCVAAGKMARRGAFRYRCSFCGYTVDGLASSCPNCHNFDTLRLEVPCEV